MSKVFAIIVTFNPDIQVLEDQYNSLHNQVKKIIYVDNCSSNKKEIEDFSKDKEVEVLYNPVNIGLGAAQNQGIYFAKKNFATHIILFDHDSVPEKSLVNELLYAEQKIKDHGVELGAIGPIYFNKATGEKYPITKYVGPFIKRLKPTNEPVEASFIIASGCLIPIGVLNVVGEMDEGLFIDYIDVEWSFRAKEKGFKIYATPTATMNHVIGDRRTSVFGRKVSVHSPFRRYYLFRNSIYMLKRPYIPIGYKIRELSFNALRLLVFFFLSKDRLLYLKYSFKGFTDGFRGVKGGLKKF